MIIGLTGPSLSGKETVKEFLVRRHKFKAYSLSDILREELRNQGKEVTRDNLYALGNALRAKHGAGALAKMTLEKIGRQWRQNFVVDSIRHPEEVAVLRKSPRFFLVALDAPVQQRFARSVARAREKDPTTITEFIIADERELYGKGNQQRIHETMTLADVWVVNDGTIRDLHKKLQALHLDNVAHVRPDWDDYFMSLALLAARRSNCVSRKVGAVLVKDKRVISTGYNGTPRGVKNCNDGGCARCSGSAKPGENLGECLCLHAEENAIIEAGRSRAEGGMLYTSFLPCLWCAKIIVQAGIKEVVFTHAYALDDASKDVFRQAKVVLRRL